MTINLDEIFKQIAPSPIVLTIGNVDYRVRDMTLADVEKLSKFSGMSDAEGLDFVAGIFDQPPPAIDQLRASFAAGESENFGRRQALLKENTLIIATLSIVFQNMISPVRMSAAVEAIAAQVRHTDQSAD